MSPLLYMACNLSNDGKFSIYDPSCKCDIQKYSHRFLRYMPYIRVGMLVKHLGAPLGNLDTNQHIRICHHNSHSIIIPTNNLNNGTLQVGRNFHLSTLLLLLILLSISIDHRDGGDKHIHSHHLYPYPIILMLNTHPMSSNFFLGLCL